MSHALAAWRSRSVDMSALPLVCGILASSTATCFHTASANLPCCQYIMPAFCRQWVETGSVSPVTGEQSWHTHIHCDLLILILVLRNIVEWHSYATILIVRAPATVAYDIECHLMIFLRTRMRTRTDIITILTRTVVDTCWTALIPEQASSLTGWFADKTIHWQDDKIATASTSAFIWRVVSELVCQRKCPVTVELRSNFLSLARSLFFNMLYQFSTKQASATCVDTANASLLNHRE